MWEKTAHRPFAGILWMVISGLAMVGVNGVVKAVGTSLPAPQAAFLRYAFGALIFLPLLPQLMRSQYPRRIWVMFALRGLVTVLAVTLWFYAMARLPVAEVSAIGFLNPVIVLILGGLLLGEGVTPGRMMVALVAFLGAMVVLRPGLREISSGHLAQFGAAISFAIAYIIAKRMSDSVPAGVIVAMMTFATAPGLGLLAWPVWQRPELWQLVWLAAGAGFATLGHYAMTRAFAAAPLAVTQPVTFLQILWAALLGMVVFGEAFDPWVILGGAMIIGAISVNIRREASARRVIRRADGAGTGGPVS